MGVARHEEISKLLDGYNRFLRTIFKIALNEWSLYILARKIRTSKSGATES